MIIEIPDYKVHSRNKTTTQHWRVYQNYRDSLKLLIMGYSKRVRFKKPVRVTIEAYFKGKRHIDTSNIDDKIIIDGLMDAKVIEDDTAYHNPEVVKRCYPKSGEDKLIIKVEKI